MSLLEDQLSAQLAALAPTTQRWAAVLRQLVQTTALAYARLYGYPIRKGRIVTRAHQRTHWGHHG